MSDLTRPIRVIANTREKGYRAKWAVAYAVAFTMLAGDAVRYSIGWIGWGALLVVLFGLAVALLVSKRREIDSKPSWPLISLLTLMAVSTLWSAYPGFTALATVAQVGTTVFAFFLAALFSWRALLNLFANTLRVILASSLLFEVIARFIVAAPIAPIFKNYSGETPPAAAYYWTQANLFTGERIQGIVGNSNLLAYLAMFGLVVFTVEFAIHEKSRWLSVGSLLLAALLMLEARSAGIGFAMVAVAAASVVSIAAEGKERDVRHRYYRIAWAVAGTFAAVVLIFRATVFEFIGKSPDMTGRSGIWKKVLELIEDRPVQGWGWISHWIPGVEPYEGLVVIGKVPYYQAHNAYLDMTLQLGAIGALLFLVMLAIAFVKLWRLAVRHTSALYLWPILFFVGLAVWSLTESRMLIENGWMLLTLFAIKVNDPLETLEPRGNSPKRVRLLSRGLRQNRPQLHKDH